MQTAADKATHISGPLMRALASLGQKKTLLGWRVVSQWPEIVGEKIAAVATAERYQDRVLYVRTKNAMWRQSLSMESDIILAEIRKFTGQRIIDRIHFR
ncbi:MAG: DUF721 domain-containing protein [Candidatus Zixiibacteriota bacterium]